MITVRQYTTILLLSCLLFAPLPGRAADQHGPMIAVVTDGRGRVDLAWLTNPARWPIGGWRLEDLGDKSVKVEGIMPGMAKTPNLAETEKKTLVQDMQRLLAVDDAEAREKGGIFLLFENLRNFDRLKTMGLGWTLDHVSAGSHRYRVTGLDRNGKKIGPVLETGPVDPSRPSPLPRPPEKLSGEITGEQVVLHWQSSDRDSLGSAVEFQIERESNHRVVALPTKIYMTTEERKTGKLSYRDDQPEPEANLVYRVSGRDIFGRRSKSATVSLFFPDPQALRPPARFAAKGGENRITLSWQPSQNPYNRGYLIERSRLATRKYRLLTPKPLAPETSSFVDKENLLPGLTYYYRIRSVNPRGRIGKPEPPVNAIAVSAHPPDRPAKVTAEVRPTRVQLHWKEGKAPVAGYLIEKRSRGEKKWQRLNGVVETRTMYDDPVHPEDYGAFEYRVIAVGHDNKESKASKKVAVRLLGNPPIPAPRLNDITWDRKGVRLSFRKGVPAERTRSLIVIRGISQRDKKGVIIADSLPPDTTDFLDTRVRPGEDYWYGLIGADREGHQSALSNKLYVRTGTIEIPTPARPELSFTETPFPHVVIRFKEPPAPLLTSVMRRRDDHSSWLTIADKIRGESRVVDADPPASGDIAYRILYTAENGMYGKPSKAGRIMLADPTKQE